MTKPFPCCCACVNCPQYETTDIWTYLLTGMTIGGGTFVSSTTGNPLHTDLNALGATDFTFGSITSPGGSGTISAYSGVLLPFPGIVWRYDGFNISNLRIEIEVYDHCSKVWVFAVLIRANTGLGITTIAAFGPASEPANPNCGSALVQIQNTPSTPSLGATGTVTLTPP